MYRLTRPSRVLGPTHGFAHSHRSLPLAGWVQHKHGPILPVQHDHPVSASRREHDLERLQRKRRPASCRGELHTGGAHDVHSQQHHVCREPLCLLCTEYCVVRMLHSFDAHSLKRESVCTSSSQCFVFKVRVSLLLTPSTRSSCCVSSLCHRVAQDMFREMWWQACAY